MATRAIPIVILGHTGAVGRALAHGLTARGYSVIGASSRQCDLTDRAQAQRFMAGVPQDAAVVFSSAITRLVDDSFGALERNLRMAENVAATAPEGRLRAVVYLSSSDVYGHRPPLPITERTPAVPASYYGIAKLAGEFLLRRSGALDCPMAILRLPGIYGPEDGGRSLIGRLLAHIVQKGQVTLTGDGSQRRDYMHEGDLCEVVRRIADQPFDGLLNVATGVSRSLREIVALLAQASGRSPRIQLAPPDPHAAGDLVFDISELRRRLPHLEFRTLEQGVTGYVAARAPILGAGTVAGGPAAR